MDDTLSILEIFAWPLAIIIIVVIFLLIQKKPIADLINKITGIKGGKYEFETEPGKRQLKTHNVLEKPVSKTEEIEKGLNLLNDETRKIFQSVIIQETELDKVESESEKNQILLKYSEALYVRLQFERVYHLIYGSQIKLLFHLNSSLNETTETVKYYYENAVKVRPGLKEYPYKNYLSFLETQALIMIGKENSINITPFGKDFLKFMIEAGLSDNIQN